MQATSQNKYLTELFQRKAEEERQAELQRHRLAKEQLRAKRPLNEEAIIREVIESSSQFMAVDPSEDTNPFMELSEILSDFTIEEIDLIRPDLFHEFKLLLVCAVRCDWNYQQVAEIIQEQASEIVRLARIKQKEAEKKKEKTLGQNYQF